MVQSIGGSSQMPPDREQIREQRDKNDSALAYHEGIVNRLKEGGEISTSELNKMNEGTIEHLNAIKDSLSLPNEREKMQTWITTLQQKLEAPGSTQQRLQMYLQEINTYIQMNGGNVKEGLEAWYQSLGK